MDSPLLELLISDDYKPNYAVPESVRSPLRHLFHLILPDEVGFRLAVHGHAFDIIERLWSARVCLFDSEKALRRAPLALQLALEARPTIADDDVGDPSERGHLASHSLGEFFADYCPLLLVAAAERALAGMYLLFGKSQKNSASKALKDVSGLPLGKDILDKLQRFEEADCITRVWKYRHHWAHEQPHIIDSDLYNPARYRPRKRDKPWIHEPWAGINRTDTWAEFVIGHNPEPSYLWPEWCAVLSDALILTAELVDSCAEVWKDEYRRLTDEQGTEKAEN